MEETSGAPKQRKSSKKRKVAAAADVTAAASPSEVLPFEGETNTDNNDNNSKKRKSTNARRRSQPLELEEQLSYQEEKEEKDRKVKAAKHKDRDSEYDDAYDPDERTPLHSPPEAQLVTAVPATQVHKGRKEKLSRTKALHALRQGGVTSLQEEIKLMDATNNNDNSNKDKEVEPRKSTTEKTKKKKKESKMNEEEADTNIGSNADEDQKSRKKSNPTAKKAKKKNKSTNDDNTQIIVNENAFVETQKTNHIPSPILGVAESTPEDEEVEVEERRRKPHSRRDSSNNKHNDTLNSNSSSSSSNTPTSSRVPPSSSSSSSSSSSPNARVGIGPSVDYNNNTNNNPNSRNFNPRTTSNPHATNDPQAFQPPPPPEKRTPPLLASVAMTDDTGETGGRLPAMSFPRLLQLQRCYEQVAPRLYSFNANHVLEWPSLAVEWISDRRFADPERDYTLQCVAVGTQAARGQRNCVRVMEVAVPVRNESTGGVMYNLSGDADLDHGDEEERENFLETVDPGKLFKNVRGHFQCEVEIAVDSPVLRIAALPAESNIIAVKTASGFIGVYNLVQNLETEGEGAGLTVADAVLRGHKTGGFGLSWNTAKLGYLGSGADDGYVNYWDVRHRLTVDLKEEEEGGGGATTTASANAPDLFGPEVQPLGRLTGHQDSVTQVDWHHTQGHLLASSSLDSDLRLWDIRSDDCATTLPNAHEGGVYSCSFHPTAAFQLASGGADGEVHLYDIRKPNEPLLALSYHGKGVTSLTWAPFADTVLASGGEDGRVVLWDVAKTTIDLAYSEDGLAPPEVSFVHLGHLGRVLDVAWCQSREEPWLLASADSCNGLHLYRPRQSEVMDYNPYLEF